MKKLLFKTILLAAVMGVGTSAWGETIGNTSDGYLAAKSTSITLTNGGSVKYVFSQATANTAVYQGFILAADKTDDTQLIRLRQDFWENIAGANTGCTANYPDGWVENYDFFNGATVDMTVTYNSGTFTMSSTIYGSDNAEYTYGYTKTIDGAPSSIVVYLSNDHAKLLIGKTVVTKGTITTTTYDFQSMGSATLSASSSNLGKSNNQFAYIPNELTQFFGGRFGFYFIDGTSATVDATNGLKYTNSQNTSRVFRGRVANMLAGDKVSLISSGTIKCYGRIDGEGTNLTTAGTALAEGTILTSGSTYYVLSDGYINPVLNHNTTWTSFTIVSNSNTNYQNLFALWKTAATNYANEEYTEGKDALATAIAAAKTVIDDEDATNDDYSSAVVALREANEYFTAINTHNTTYSVTSSSAMSDGTNVKSVYGMTMTYHGTWSHEYNSGRFGNAARSASAYISDGISYNIPSTGDYIVFAPTLAGNLQIKGMFYGGHTDVVLVDGENGHIYKEYKNGSNNWGYVDFGDVVPGRTYILYSKSLGDWGNGLSSFIFTPGENTTTSYSVMQTELAKGGMSIDCVNGITMTYGGTSEETWSWLDPAKNRGGFYNTGNATVSGVTPTGKTYMIFNPTVNGILTISGYIYNGNEDCTTYLSDGTSREAIGQAKNTLGSGKHDRTFSTVLKAGETYYVYFYEKSYTSSFNGFTFTPTPATVSATIGGTGFATFSSEYPLDFSATTTKAYAASLTADNTVLLSPVTAVPANTGLLLKGATEDIPVKAGFGAAAPATNLLKASEDADIAASVEGTYHYVLANGSKGVGFYNLAAAKNIGTGKAYLETTTPLAPLAAASEARVAWIFADDAETTGIDSMNIVPCANNKEIFNLNGQRVDNPTRGLYIVNGKKVIIK